MPFLAAGPDITPITDLITTWIHIGQALVGSVGALAFIFACRQAVDPAHRRRDDRCRGCQLAGQHPDELGADLDNPLRIAWTSRP